YGSAHDYPAAGQRLVQFWGRTDQDRYYIESRSVMAGDATVWNAPHHEANHPLAELRNSPQVGSSLSRPYRWLHLPGFYLLFNESTSTGFHYFFWRNANGNPDQALAMIDQAALAMHADVHKRYLAYTVNRLALQLEDFARTPEGQQARAAGRLSSSMF